MRLLLFIAAALVFGVSPASAACNLSNLKVAPTSVNAGTYTPPTAPTAVGITLTVSGSYVAVPAGSCTVGLGFNRLSLPPVMTISAGTTTMPYAARTLPGGGNSVIYSVGPNSSNVMQSTIQGSSIVGTFSLNFTVYFLLQPNSPQLAGSYSDGLTVHVFSVIGSTYQETFTTAFNVSGTVNKACTIGGVAHPAADSATIAITAGKVSTAPISRSYANVSCNIRSSVQLTSQKGAVVTAASVPTGFTNMIDYVAGATFSGGSATLDTSTKPSATGPESGSAVNTTGTTPNGSLAVTITPRTNTLALIAGSYNDTLTITLTPQ